MAHIGILKLPLRNVFIFTKKKKLSNHRTLDQVMGLITSPVGDSIMLVTFPVCMYKDPQIRTYAGEWNG